MRDQRSTGPIECWTCHGLGHTQARCPNEKKPVDYTSLCRYCSGEDHVDDECPKRRSDAHNGKGKGPVGFSNYVDTQTHPAPRAQEQVPTIGVVFRTPNPWEGSISLMHFVDVVQGKDAEKEPIVAIVTQMQEYIKKNTEDRSENANKEKVPERVEGENQVRGFAQRQEFEDGDEIEILPPVTKNFVPGKSPFPERRKAPKFRKEKQI
ncbi:hypothetical protein KP509_24G075100 [Ceratopteris richardii]|uniref:CCHC-type domain-containing protein n=1 Tax=Ceratopteris richardii TaxID=49495 RepID=A0A8T2RVU8_CERRI|nr:hypothetical protein KP509_24G075100 [Ceratopteris richardii]